MEVFKKSVSVLFSLILSMAFSFSSFADFTDSLAFYTASGSNAAMSTSNDVTTRAIVVPNPANTVDWSGCSVWLRHRNSSGVVDDSYRIPISVAGTFKYIIPPGKTYNEFLLDIHPSSLPVQGTYNTQFWYYSDASIEYSWVSNWMKWTSKNQAAQSTSVRLNAIYNSGDLYSNFVLGLNTNVVEFLLDMRIKEPFVSGNAVGGKFYLSFSQSSGAVDVTSPGRAPSSDDIQSGISNSVGQIADSVGDIVSGIGNIASDMAQANANLSYISNSQQLIIQGIDNVILHISDQLYAFWDQLYNLIHLPEMDMMGQILQAIKDINFDITVDFGDLKKAISSMSSAIQDKIQGQITNDNKIHEEQISNDNQIADNIMNGYDDSALNSANNQLNNALQENAAAEDQIMEQISEPLESFTFDNPITQYLSTFILFGNFLQDLFTSSGAFKDVINLSFIMGIALMVAGLYRFKGGN